MARALFRSFAARFDPAVTGDRAEAIAESEKGVRAALEAVRSLAEDEVLRALDNLVRSSLRTNFYQSPERPVVAIKVDSRKVEGMPSPRPMFEIYVHSRLIQGIHLRGGKVARGGIRWSDRHDDFRTEILGLMKTQMVKNAIIVPVGSKGGFVLKGDVPPRPALDAYLIDRYREFVSGPPRRHRQHRGRRRRSTRPRSCATTPTIRTSWWRPTRGRRTSPTPRTASRRSTASGSATPSPPGGASATTTRRSGSRPAGRGSA